MIIPFIGHFSDREYVMQIYEQHNSEIHKYIPAERLLIYRVEQGWKPLCQFLNVLVPTNTPFPRVNDRQQLIEVLNCSKMVFGLFYYWYQY